MEAIAIQKYIRMSPRKLRLVADMVRPMTPANAVETLPYVHKRAAKPMEKVIRSAIANATSQGAREETLTFKEIQVTEGPRLKRGNPVSRGMWHPIVKRMSHIRVVVTNEEIKKNPKHENQNSKQTRELKSSEPVAAREKKADKTGKTQKKPRKETKK